MKIQNVTQISRQLVVYLVSVMLLLAICTVPVLAKPGNGKGQGGGKGGGGGGGGDTGSATSYQPELRQKWRAALDGPYSLVRPAVGPNGTIYVVDVSDNLYAFNPNPAADGSAQLIWKAANAGSKGVDVSADGNTVYTGNEDWIKAFNAVDGSEKWTYLQEPRAFILIDVAVAPVTGPNPDVVCGVATNGIGVFCLEDGGQDQVSLLWKTPEDYHRPIVAYTEIAFGPGAQDTQLYFAANGHTRAVNVSDGSEVFSTTYAGLPVVSPLDGTWHLGGAAYNPDASLAWLFGGFPDATGAVQPSLSRNGVHYTVNQGFRVFAIDSNGSEIWRTELNETADYPDVDPSDSQVLIPTISLGDVPAAILALNTGNGQRLWRSELQPPAAGVTLDVDAGLAFSPDGDTAYVLSQAVSPDAVYQRTYLHALSTDPSIPNASTVLRSVGIDLKGRVKGSRVSMSGTVKVTDENQAPISGAAVTVTWDLPDGSTTTQTATTGGSGIAKFSVSDKKGMYVLTLDDIVYDPYRFDAEHSLLRATQLIF